MEKDGRASAGPSPSSSSAVRRLGEPLPTTPWSPLELILPASDATLEEVRDMLSDDGLIPG